MKSRNFVISMIVGIIFFLAIVYSTVIFNSTVNEELESSARTTLVDLANQQQIALNRQLESMVFGLSSVAETLPFIGTEEDEIVEYVTQKQALLDFETAFIADSDGMAYMLSGEMVDISNADFFKVAISGEVESTRPHVSKYSNKEVAIVAVPIIVDGKITGVFAVEYCTEYLTSLLTAFSDERGLTIIVDKNSEIMMSTNSFVISFDAFKTAEFKDEASFESVVDDFQNGKSGSISYTLNGENKLGEYRPIAINDWMLFFEISEASIINSVQNISKQMILTSALIIAFAFMTILYVILSKNASARVLEQAAYYDELTGIPNLLKFKLMVAERIKKDPNKEYTMVKMDLVNFKAINEMFGFDAGNRVICAIADTGKTVGDSSFIQARVASEEFMFFSEKELFEHLEESSKGFEFKFKTLIPELEEHQFTFRYGRYFVKPGENDVNDLVNKTNIAHSFAKGDNINNIWNYDEAFTYRVLKDTEIANKMHKALENKEFKVFLQPKCSVKNSEVSGAEALVRWVESDGDMVFPNEFIPLFEQNGFIVELDKYMLKNVCAALKSWTAAGLKPVPISVNFSRLHIRNEKFVDELVDIVTSYGVKTNLIEIELTESTIMENESELKKLLSKLHDAGFLVSIDDFGSGYSSLGMLKNFKVDTLKLDRSFFVEIEDEDEHKRGDLVVESIIELASSLGMYTVAEGIEEKKQVEFLRRINCDAAQGYLYARPMPISEFEKMYL